MTGDSYIVSLFGLDGQREHWMPGNRRKGTGPREKRGFDTEEEARAFLAQQPDKGEGWVIYPCAICPKYHTAHPPRT